MYGKMMLIFSLRINIFGIENINSKSRKLLGRKIWSVHE